MLPSASSSWSIRKETNRIAYLKRKLKSKVEEACLSSTVLMGEYNVDAVQAALCLTPLCVSGYSAEAVVAYILRERGLENVRLRLYHLFL
mgnify:CR=1 FL=1